ncbi:hypothetical protein FOMPIDRAFT_1025825 [Fomitopsis schrenkii]|uniref:Protein kinase domain-containing protein n=1 Tax=Fomitopsis schrenkii TaxID=2126942 RepID=S8DRN2_FOMSC|nr:hypothetical protein FOMPIDRAFT_1025825 [Fomitopsis schrenkii]
MPAFILAIAGPHISVSGVIFLDGVVSQRLTPLIPLAQSYSDNPRLDEDGMGMVTWGGKHTMEIARLFKSLRESVDELDDYYLTIQKPSDFAPAPHFRSFGEVKLTYLSRLPEDRRPCDRRTIFLAEAHGGGEDGTQCVVKFADRYGRRAHEFMYERGVAARLMHYEEVPSAGGLFAVVTEYVEHKPDAVPSTEGMEKLAKALLELHDKEKLVLGDLRSPNVLVDSSGQPQLIDFDWSGPDGKMRYPGDLNTTDIKWPEGAGPYAFITKEHDVAMLEDLKGFYASKKASCNRVLDSPMYCRRP